MGIIGHERRRQNVLHVNMDIIKKKMKHLFCLIRGHNWIYSSIQTTESNGLPVRQCEYCGKFQYTVARKISQDGWIDDWNNARNSSYCDAIILASAIKKRVKNQVENEK